MASEQQGQAEGDQQGATAVATKQRKAPRRQPPKPLPPWKVLLHNDDKNDMGYVVLTICQLTTLNETAAMERTIEAHNTGLSLLLVTHRERAELYQEQFQSKGLVVTIEPDEAQ